MATKMQQRRGTAAEWTVANEVLADGAIGVEEDTGKFKFGNGSTPWNSLLYSSIIPGLIDAVGDLIVGSGDNTPARLPAGSTGQRLEVGAGGVLQWSTPTPSVPLSIIDAAGDVLVGTADNTVGRLAIGANGRVLGVSAGALAWVVPSADVPLATVTTAGDLIIATGAGAVGRLGKGASAQVLTIVAGNLAWADLPNDPTLSAVTTAGDMIVATGAGAIGRLAKGSNGQVLTMATGAVGWVTPTASIPLSTVTTAGDLIVGSGAGAVTRLARGADAKILGMTGTAVGWVDKPIIICTSTTRPTQVAGIVIFETDTSATYVSDGTTWQPIPNGAKTDRFVRTRAGTARNLLSGLMVAPLSGGSAGPITITFAGAFGNTPQTVCTAQYILGSVSNVVMMARPVAASPLASFDYQAYSWTNAYNGNLTCQYIATDAA